MKRLPASLVAALARLMIFPIHAAELPPAPGANARPLFDGTTLAGWEGNAKLWRYLKASA